MLLGKEKAGSNCSHETAVDKAGKILEINAMKGEVRLKKYKEHFIGYCIKEKRWVGSN